MSRWGWPPGLWHSANSQPDSPNSIYFSEHHRLLDPEYSSRAIPGQLETLCRDDEGNLHPSTYRPFPLLTPPPKKKPRERIAHFQKFKVPAHGPPSPVESDDEIPTPWFRPRQPLPMRHGVEHPPRQGVLGQPSVGEPPHTRCESAGEEHQLRMDDVDDGKELLGIPVSQ